MSGAFIRRPVGMPSQLTPHLPLYARRFVFAVVVPLQVRDWLPLADFRCQCFERLLFQPIESAQFWFEVFEVLEVWWLA